ncbi:hypothetical protein [Luteimonas notoginsengisoli]|uniref:DUF2029 domain-containing protein n=1 Tax=Luteimonas notoginsengisoli TaxID=1578200 RepID=A0ABV7UTS4_9GAMM
MDDNSREDQFITDGSIRVNSGLVAMARVHGPWLLLFAACAAVVIMRRPDVILNPQFWAEDGKIWFANAHNLGAWHSLFLPQNGYLQTVSRLVAGIATLVPMRWAPLTFNLAAVAVQVLPVLLLNGGRGRALVPSVGARLVLSVLYIAQPYTTEVHANLTNAQWHLAVSAALVCCFDDWKSGRQVATDIVLVALFCVSGPFCILLLPCVAWLAYRRRDRRAMWLLALILSGACIQLALAVPQMGVSRAVAPLGATWQGFLRIAGGQVVLAGLIGDAWRHVYLLPPWREGIALPFIAATLGAAVLWRAWRLGNDGAIGFIVFTLFVFIAALLSPQLSTTAQWVIWEVPHAGERYSFLPILGFYAALMCVAAYDRSLVSRALAIGMLGCVVLVALPASWKIRAFGDFAYRQHVEAYAEAGPGDVVRIPINPAGWFMELRKPMDAQESMH